MSLESFILDNGLKVYLVNNNTKHTTYINLIVKFGGLDNEIIIDNKKHKITSGSAHFLEHLVLEKSKYGDLMKIFGQSGIRSNGLTSIIKTQFYIDTVKDVEKNLELLIKGIHSPIITEKNIFNIKQPILEEKRKSLDNKYSSLYNSTIKNVINAKHFDSILGSYKDIESIKEEDMILAFNTFYRPTNEIIVIGGRFDKKKVLKVINDAYKVLKFDTNEVKKVPIKYNSKVNKKKEIIKENINMERTVISFKLNNINMSSFDKILLDIYLFFFLKMNFGIMSNLNKNLINNNIIIGNINFSSMLLEGYHIIKIEANTKDNKLFTKITLDYILNKKYILDKDFFDLYKKNYILDIITRNDNIYDMVDPLIENIISFNYENLDSIKDIENMKFNIFKNTIENINFNNYSISVLKPK